MRRSMPFAAPVEAPIHELNTTPLIDVMLVLLIMFIITIPLAAHKVPMDLPKGVETERKPVVHLLELDEVGRIRLNGQAVNVADLPRRLTIIAREPSSDLLLRADGETPYERFDQILVLVKRAGIARMGMTGNEAFVPALDRPAR